MMLKCVEQRSKRREYREFLRRKVEIARVVFRAGRIFTNEEVEAEAAA
jgi:hypothetical protein